MSLPTPAQQLTSPRLPISCVSSTMWKATAPATCKRWESSEANPKLWVQKDEARELEKAHPKTKKGQRWTYSSSSVQTWDYSRMRAGVVHLVPHKDEPDACIFVAEGDEQWLDAHKGTLDSDGKRRRLVV